MLPNGKYAYVANSLDNTVSVIDTSTNKVTDTIKNTGSGGYLVASPDGKYVYATNYGSDPGSVSVIDTTTNSIVTKIPVSGLSYGETGWIAISPDGNRVYAVNADGNYEGVAVIDTNPANTGRTTP